MRDAEQAKQFGLIYGLLASEHWGQPIHRLQEHLFADLVKAAFVHDPPLLRGMELHPRDRLYTVDGDALVNTRYPGMLNDDLHTILSDIGNFQRRIFTRSRLPELQQYLYDQSLPGHMSVFPRPLQPISDRGFSSGFSPPQVELISGLPMGNPKNSEYALEFRLPAFKTRTVDPLVFRGAESVRLSSLNPYYDQSLKAQKEVQLTDYTARVYAAPEFIARVVRNLVEIRGAWAEGMAQPYEVQHRKALKHVLRSVGAFAIATTPLKLELCS